MDGMAFVVAAENLRAEAFEGMISAISSPQTSRSVLWPCSQDSKRG